MVRWTLGGLLYFVSIRRAIQSRLSNIVIWQIN